MEISRKEGAAIVDNDGEQIGSRIDLKCNVCSAVSAVIAREILDAPDSTMEFFLNTESNIMLWNCRTIFSICNLNLLVHVQSR